MNTTALLIILIGALYWIGYLYWVGQFLGMQGFILKSEFCTEEDKMKYKHITLALILGFLLWPILLGKYEVDKDGT